MIQNSRARFIILLAGTILVLSGCGKQSDTGVKNGVQQMLSITSKISAEIKTNDQAGIQKDGPTLENVWSSYEDQVKAKHSVLYAQVEKYLDPLVAAAKAQPTDFKITAQLNKQLSSVLKQLQSAINQ